MGTVIAITILYLMLGISFAVILRRNNIITKQDSSLMTIITIVLWPFWVFVGLCHLAYK